MTTPFAGAQDDDIGGIFNYSLISCSISFFINYYWICIVSNPFSPPFQLPFQIKSVLSLVCIVTMASSMISCFHTCPHAFGQLNRWSHTEEM